MAEPFIPTDEAQVLERLPDRSALEYRELKILKARAAAEPGNVDAAVALADAYYKISRREGDPRYLGYAQAALTPWWNDPIAPTAGAAHARDDPAEQPRIPARARGSRQGHRARAGQRRARSWSARPS